MNLTCFTLSILFLASCSSSRKIVEPLEGTGADNPIAIERGAALIRDQCPCTNAEAVAKTVFADYSADMFELNDDGGTYARIHTTYEMRSEGGKRYHVFCPPGGSGHRPEFWYLASGKSLTFVRYRDAAPPEDPHK